jgi:hypothetical protein
MLTLYGGYCVISGIISLGIPFTPNILIAMFIFSIFFGTVSCIFGVAGIVSAHKKLKAMFLIFFGAALLCMLFIDSIWFLSSYNDPFLRFFFSDTFFLTKMIGSLLIFTSSVIYIVTGNINKCNK